MARQGVEGFVPDRLIEARESRAIFQSTLADLVGVSRQSISNYESGKNVPTQSIISKIAEKLSVPFQFFFFNNEEPLPSAIFYRSRKSATDMSRKSVETHFKWQIRIAKLIKQYLELNKVEFPNFDIKDPSSLTSENIERFAAECRTHWSLGLGALSNITLLLENNGTMFFLQNIEDPKLDAFSSWVETLPCIVLKKDQVSATRQRFNVAHELAHLLLHQNVKEIGKLHNILEDQANLFASNFLLPAESFARDLQIIDLDFLVPLKKKWKVSIAAMIERCFQLKLASDEKRTSLWKKLSARGWRQAEPLDNELSAEEPVMLKRCFEVLRDSKIASPESLEFDLRLFIDEIERLSNLRNGFFKGETANVIQFPTIRTRH